jgi:phage repressor protein C with HTH and peptisase S24 domain
MRLDKRLGLAVVRGRSMLPTLRDGDRLLVRYGALPRPGRLAVVRLPDGVVSVKRLEVVDAEGYWFSRDNAHEGLDSWALGRASTAAEVLGVVRARVWPRPGPLRRRPPG